MTREEEIKQASKDFSYDATEGHLYHDLECGFRNGAKWADEHPVNPWHKVSEELPKVPKGQKWIKVFVHSESDDFTALFSPISGFSPTHHTDNLQYITHWMYIPEIKEG